jgi:hypothetical protein
MTDLALRKMSSRFDKMYSKTGRPSIAPEKLLRAQLLQTLVRNGPASACLRKAISALRSDNINSRASGVTSGGTKSITRF